MGAIKTENFSSVEITNEQDLWIWLSNNFGSQESVWLITYKKSTPQKYLSREQVLDALIAYGWIDGVRRKLDDQRTMQLISQRKTQSWSATYKQRADRLEAEGRTQQSGRDTISQSKLLGLWDAMQDVDTFVITNDLQILLDKDRTAATYFKDCPPSCKRNVLRWLKSAKTEGTRQKRLHSIFTECKTENRIPQM